MASTTRRRFTALGLAAGAGLALPGRGFAQAYPDRPVKLVVPYPAGNAIDVLARILADEMGKAMPYRFVIENQAGAGGNTGTAAVAKAPADGYTLLASASGPLAVNRTLTAKLPYDPIADFEHLSLYATVPNILVVTPSLPVKDVAEFIAYARSRPGALNYGTVGAGSSQHLAAVYFEAVTGVKMQHVPYRAAGQLVTDLFSGDIQCSFQLIPNVVAQLQSGQIRALAVTTLKRSSAYPAVPTMAEAGVKDYDTYGWFGLLAPKGTPAAILDRIHGEMTRALSQDSVRKAFQRLGGEPITQTPAEFRAFIEAETVKYRDIIQAAGIQPE